ncbi:MAG: hypothetical protein PV358_14035 [Acidimicrobiales bacterium]|nr:hypothetical protein [Acidimicrobiales bacterium]
MSLPRSLAAACVAAVLVTACASESDGNGGASGGGGTDDRSISGYLTSLPAPRGDDMVLVTYADLARAAEIGGVERPDDLGETDAIADYLMEIGGQQSDAQRVAALVPTAAQLQRSATDLGGFEDEVGWSILDVDAFAERDTPPRRVSLLQGDFDRGRLDAALDDNGDAGWVVGNPEGGIDIEGVSVARPLGETLWMDLAGDRLAVAWEDGDIDRVAQADGGDGTLAGDPGLAALAAALDDLEVYSAMLVSDAGMLGAPFAERVLGASATPERVDALEDLPPCTGMTAVATAIADDGEPLLVLAIAHTDEDAAEGNVDAVTTALTEGDQVTRQRPWSETLTVESVEAEGTVVVATARPADMVLAQWYQLIVDRSFPPC